MRGKTDWFEKKDCLLSHWVATLSLAVSIRDDPNLKHNLVSLIMAEYGDDMMETPIMINGNYCQTSTSCRTLGLVAGHDAVEPQPEDQSYVGNKTLEPQSKDQSRIALEIRQRPWSRNPKITHMRVMLYWYWNGDKNISWHFWPTMFVPYLP